MRHEYVVRSNGLGTASFVLGLVAFLTCGLLSPLALLFAMLAILKPPRGMAFAGLILGALGSWWLVAGGAAIVFGVLGLNEAARISRENIAAADAEEQRLESEAASLPESPAPEEVEGLQAFQRLKEARAAEPNRTLGAERFLEQVRGKSLADLGRAPP